MKTRFRIAVFALMAAVAVATSCGEDPIQSSAGHPPVIESRSPADTLVYVDIGQHLPFSVQARDPDGDQLQHRYTLGGEAAGSGPRWTYVVDDTGEVMVVCVVTDGLHEARVGWRVERRHVNRAPRIESFVPMQSELVVGVGEAIEFSILVVDPDDDPLEYYFRVNGVLVSTDRTVSFTPSEPGRVAVEAFAWDGELVVTRRWVVNVLGSTDRPPVIYDYDPRLAEFDLRAGETVEFYILANDPDGDPVTYQFTVDGEAVSTRSTFLFQALELGTHTIEGIVTSQGLSTSRAWIATVRANRAPMVLNHSPASLSPSISVGETVRFSVDATDPDGDDVTVTFRVDGTEIPVEPWGGIELTPAAPGQYSVLAEVSDALDVTTVTWLLSVTDDPVNRAPVIASVSPPTSQVSMFAGDEVAFAVEVSDPDGDPLEQYYTVGGVFAVAGATFSFIGDPGEYLVQFVASDGELEVRRNWVVTVFDPSATLSGRIRDAVTGEPIAGVLVDLDVLAGAVTDASGVFSFEGIPPNEGTLRVQDETELGPFGDYFDYTRVFSASEGTYLELFLLPNMDMPSPYYTDFHQFFRAMTDVPGIPYSTAQRRWELPIDLHVPAFSAGGLDYRATILSVAAEFDGIFDVPAFHPVETSPAVGVEIAYSPSIYADNYSVEEWSPDYYPLKGRIRFRTHYAASTVESFKVIIRHEFGHALGLYHSLDRRHLMVGGQVATVPWFSAEELAALRARYRIPRGHEMLDHIRD